MGRMGIYSYAFDREVDFMPKKRLKMSDSREVRRTINRISNMVLNGEIDAKTANAIIYACNVCLGAIRVDEQQAKIDELEKILRDMEARRI